ncbi:thiol-disulfide oxidoreductase DCC family protein [Frankia sp. AgB32]|uniref:thiol-disulfide oxidoreductase DCC family protein n=1 Tax=Frankia sp. AgB32 TaxID=631119 RepID=UPI002010455B|nr:DUF393 domain-containing protein [Frankia sp. AgB32]MCK9896257.1 DUF393 domain-containing protein [Frankia sp. AgB32]
MSQPILAQPHRPSARPLVVFDGDCGFCTTSVRVIRERIRPAVDFEAWQRLDLTAVGLTVDEVTRAVQWVGPDGTRASGAAAFARLLGRAARPWRMVGRVLRMPPVSWIAAGSYRLIANNRQRLPGGSPACALPGPDRPGERRGG